MRNSLLILFFLLTLSILSVSADDTDIPMEDNRSIVQYVGDEYKKLDAEMNALYMTLMKAQIKPEFLKKAQQAWIKFRDAECEYSVSNSCVKKSSLFNPLTRYGCLIRLTKARINDFQMEIKAGCPSPKR